MIPLAVTSSNMGKYSNLLHGRVSSTLINKYCGCEMDTPHVSVSVTKRMALIPIKGKTDVNLDCFKKVITKWKLQLLSHTN